MASKLQHWTPEVAKKELKKRLDFSCQTRSRLEKYWADSEQTVYGTGYNVVQRVNHMSHLDSSLDQVDNSEADVNISYAFKNLRFLHAQMSSNPPSCVARPASNDPSDRMKADAADRLIRHAIRTYKFQEFTDKACLNTLLYGTGLLKLVWDPNRGQILDIDDEGNITNEGDFCVSIPNIWDIFIDPDADSWEDVRYVFERRLIPYEEACYMWPEHKEKFDQIRQETTNPNYSMSKSGGGTSPFLKSEKHDIIEIFEYWEKGLPVNAFLGRYAVCLPDGTPLKDPKPSPHSFRPSDDSKARYKVAELPYHVLTDIDVPNTVYGKSVIDYVAPIQQTMNRLDSVNLDNIQAHGVTRLVISENTEIVSQMTTSPWDVVVTSGPEKPHFMSPPSTMPAVDRLRDQIRSGIDEIFGVNESMFGQQSRETAGFAMQYATNQGNMIRRRLFNKYAMFVESIYKSYLNLVRENWDTGHTIKVIGREKALEAVEIQGSDINGGFDLVVEYGQALSLDPMTRREEIMSLQPLFEQAGVPPRVSLKMMKLNELEGLYDMMQLAEDRQREIFEEMIATNTYIPPEELQDHVNMLAYALQYLMTTEYKYLEDDLRKLIIQHIKERSQIAAQEKAGMPNAGGPMPPGPAPQLDPNQGSPLAGSMPLNETPVAEGLPEGTVSPIS